MTVIDHFTIKKPYENRVRSAELKYYLISYKSETELFVRYLLISRCLSRPDLEHCLFKMQDLPWSPVGISRPCRGGDAVAASLLSPGPP